MWHILTKTDINRIRWWDYLKPLKISPWLKFVWPNTLKKQKQKQKQKHTKKNNQTNKRTKTKTKTKTNKQTNKNINKTSTVRFHKFSRFDFQIITMYCVYQLISTSNKLYVHIHHENYRSHLLSYRTSQNSKRKTHWSWMTWRALMCTP